MIYSRETLGKRLRMLRVDLGLSQSLVCEEMDIPQASLSSFENGTGGGLTIFLDLLNFYSSHYNVSNVLVPNFYVMKKGEKNLNTGTKERIFEEIEELEEDIRAKLLNIKIIARGAGNKV